MHYTPTLGPEQFRRTLYAFWRRNSPPAYLFDAASRRECEVGLRRTNSPLHALALLNDRSYLQAARGLARQQLRDSSAGVVGRMFERVLLRSAGASELLELERVHAQALAHYAAQPEDARAFLEQATPILVEDEGSATALEPSALAAATVVASLLFNLDEAQTRE